MSDTNRRDIELRIRAQDLSTATFKSVADAVKSLTAAVDTEVAAAQKAAISNGELTASMTRLKQAGDNLANIQGLIDGFKNLGGVIENSQRNVDAAAAKLAAYRVELDSSGKTGRAAERALAGLVATLERQEAILLRNKAAQDQINTTLQKAGIDTRNLAAAETELKATFDLISPALTKLNGAHLDYSKNLRLTKEETARLREEEKIRVQGLKDAKKAQDDQTAALQKFNEETKKLAATQRSRDQQSRSIRDQEDRDRATLAVRGTTTGGTPGSTGNAAGLFGLRPYELQNLSYQVNDIVSGFASGQRATQIFAQQGGQVLQLFNKNLFALGAYLPQIALGIGTVSAAIFILTAAVQTSNSLREFSGLLKINADGANFSAEAINNLRRQIVGLGVSWAETGVIARQAIATGLNQNQIGAFAQAARALSDTPGVKSGQSVTIVDAFKDLTESFSKGQDGIRKFNTEYHQFSADELIRITQLYAEKKGAEALTFAINTLFARLSEEGKRVVSPTTQAFRDLGKAWHDFLTTLADTGAIQNVLANLTKIVEGVSSTITNIRSLIDYAENSPTLKLLLLFKQPTSLIPFGGAPDLTPAQRKFMDQNVIDNSGIENPKGVKIDTPELVKATTALTEAFRKSGLADAYKLQLISTERPGSLTYKGTPSEHGTGRAVDVVIVDQFGNPIPGSMGTPGAKIDSTGMYAALDKAFEAVVKEKFPGTSYAIGTRFSDRSDPGHYSIGGQEAANQANREGRSSGGDNTFSARQDAVDNAKEIVRLAEREQQIKFDINQQSALAAFTSKTEEEARAKIPGDDAAIVMERQKLVDIAVNDFKSQQYEKRIEFQTQLHNLFVSDGKNAVAIAEAGKSALDSGIARATAEGRVLTIAQAQTIELQGQENARKKFAEDEKFRTEKRTIEDQLAALARQNELQDTTTLENRLKSVSNQYTNIRNNLQKLADETKNMTIGPRVQELVSSLGPKIGEQQSQATSLATAKFYMDQLQSISSRRQELVTAENAAVTAGAQTQTEAEQHIKAAYAETTPEIEKAAAALKEFLATDKNIDPVRVELYTAKMKALSAEAQYVSPQFKELKSVIENSFVSNATNALNTVTEAIGNAIAKTAQWKDVWRSVGVAAAQFFAGLLKDIATAIIKMEVLKALGLGGGGGISGDIAGFFTGGSTGSGGGGLFGIGGLFGSQGPLFGTAADASIAAGGPPLALALHSGGVVGRSGTPRSVSPTWFANAPRYHSGSIVGLAPDEQAAILRRGEEVLSQGNPRNIMNGGGNGIAIRNVLVMDPMQIPAAMAGAHGEKVTISHIVNNIATVRQLVRG